MGESGGSATSAPIPGFSPFGFPFVFPFTFVFLWFSLCFSFHLCFLLVFSSFFPLSFLVYFCLTNKNHQDKAVWGSSTCVNFNTVLQYSAVYHSNAVVRPKHMHRGLWGCFSFRFWFCIGFCSCIGSGLRSAA